MLAAEAVKRLKTARQDLLHEKDDVQQMTTQLREGIVRQKGSVRLDGTVECDEVYLVVCGMPLQLK